MIDTYKLVLKSGKLSWDDIDQHAQVHPDQKLFAIIDGGIDDDFYLNLQKYYPIETWKSIYANLPEGNSPAATPFLVSMDKADNPRSKILLSYLLSLPQLKLENCIFLWSESTLGDLAEHLEQYAVIKTAEGERAILRFHDPNIWAAALAVQTDTEQTGFLSCINEAWCPDLDYVWWAYRFNPPTMDKQPFQPVEWDKERHTRFNELTQPRKILLYLESEHEEKITGSRVAWLQKIQNWLVDANTMGTITPSEQTLYCVTALFVGDKFYEVPEVAQALREIGKRHADFTQAIQSIAPDVWERLENQLLSAPER